MMNRKRIPLALPLVSIALIVGGMTQKVFAASEHLEVTSAATGISAVDLLLERVTSRMMNRIIEAHADNSSGNIFVRKTHSATRNISRALLSSSSRRSQERSSASTATIHAAAPAVAVSDNPGNDLNAEVFRLVNDARALEGLPPYTYSNTLEKSAISYAVHMREETCFSHSACGSTLKERMHASGYYKDNGRSYSYGENIARGQDDATEVVNDWLNSPSHRGAILSTTFKEIGIGRSGDYWVQHFGVVR